MIAEELVPEIETGQRFRPGQAGSVVSFYRATLSVSAVFAVARCPSVVCHVRAFDPDG